MGIESLLSVSDRAELLHLANGAAPNAQQAKPRREEEVLFELMSGVEEEEIDCLWVNRVPRGKVTLFVGESEVGKSTVTSKIVSTISRGDALPFDQEPEAPLRSVILSAEEGLADTMKKRLRILGADQDMVAIPKRSIPLGKIDATFLDRLLAQHPAALTVIDPITSYVHGQSITKPEIRNILMTYVPVAEKHRTALIMTAHLNRGTNANKALDRILGSSEFRNIPRSIFLFALDPQNPERRLMTHEKCSFGRKQPTLEFFIEEDGSFRWGNQTSERADDLLLGIAEPAKQRESVQLDRAKRFLEERLNDGPKPYKLLESEAEKLGIKRALWRAKPELGIESHKGPKGRWIWSLSNSHEQHG